MPKSKENMALFELMRRRQTNEEMLRDADTTPGSAWPSDRVLQERSDGESPAPQATGDRRTPSFASRRWLVVDGERVRFSLSTLSLATVVVSLIVLLVLSYQLGHSSGFRSGEQHVLASVETGIQDDISRTLQQPADASVLEELDLVKDAVIAEQAQEEYDRPSSNR